MPWGQERRLEFIDFRLQWDGKLNRSDLLEHFGISVPQASTDIGTYTGLAPKNLIYDRSARAYLAGETFSPLFATSSAEHYLSDLLALSNGTLDMGGSFAGWTPAVALAISPARVLPAQALESVLRAVRTDSALEVMYQSMSKPEPEWRCISPHALGHDGFRWHVRAFCHARKAFRDFVFSRMLEVRPSLGRKVRPDKDHAWFSSVNLVLVPHSGLSPSMRRVVELDYAMTEGETVLVTRQAMLYYVLQRLGLSRDGDLRPEAQQIELKNGIEVRAVLEGLSKSYE